MKTVAMVKIINKTLWCLDFVLQNVTLCQILVETCTPKKIYAFLNFGHDQMKIVAMATTFLNTQIFDCQKLNLLKD